MAAPKATTWAALVVAAALLVAGASGALTRWGALLPLGNPVAALSLAALGMLPLAFAFLALERGRPAPALRSWAAPWVLAALAYASIQLSGGANSPLWPLYGLLGLYWGRHIPWTSGLALALALTALQSIAFSTLLPAAAGSPWPGALSLIWTSVGLLLGWLTLEGKFVRARPAPTTPAESGIEVGKAPERLDDTLAVSGGPADNAAALMGRDIQASLDLAMASHPQWNALALWWGSSESVRLGGLRLRSGQGAELGGSLESGEGLLGLVLKEKRIISIEPLAATAVASLAYYREPGAAKMLRALPLLDEGRFIGLLACDKVEDHPFGGDEAGALDALGRVLIGHAQRAAFLQRLQDAGGRTNRLYEATKRLAASLNREDLLERFGPLLKGVLALDSWVLGWRDEERGDFLLQSAEGYLLGPGTALGFEQNAALMAAMEASDSAVIFNGDASAIPAALNAGLARTAKHFLLVPLRLNGRLTGVLKLDRRLAPFEEHERESALIFGNQAAITLENARLYSLHERLATTDGLTGLYNHRFFQERLAVEITEAEKSGRPLSLAMTDIDHFKKFNDTFGHQEGDVVLRKVAKLLQDQVRAGKDIVCRYGGEEFVIIMPDCDVVEARLVMDRLRAHCGANLIGGIGPQATPITMSVGLSTYPQAAKEQRDLIHAADEALYKAKKSGRDQVCSFKDLP